MTLEDSFVVPAKADVYRFRLSASLWNNIGMETVTEILNFGIQKNIILYAELCFNGERGFHILATGTLIYKGAMGGAALENLYVV